MFNFIILEHTASDEFRIILVLELSLINVSVTHDSPSFSVRINYHQFNLQPLSVTMTSRFMSITRLRSLCHSLWLHCLGQWLRPHGVVKLVSMTLWSRSVAIFHGLGQWLWLHGVGHWLWLHGLGQEFSTRREIFTHTHEKFRVSGKEMKPQIYRLKLLEYLFTVQKDQHAHSLSLSICSPKSPPRNP